jgi:phosphoglycolate phosphatase-like HAD superfamily hydrolase
MEKEWKIIDDCVRHELKRLHIWSMTSVILVTLRHSPEMLNWELDYLGLLPYFNQVLSASGENAVMGKGPVKASMVQQIFGLEPSSGWFIGDTETDIVAGKLLGLHTAAVTFGIRTAEQLRVQTPDILIDSPEQLIEWVLVMLK